MRQAKTLRSLIITLLMTLPHLVNISSLLLLMYFIYAVLGMQLFAKVQFGDNLSEHANFRTFWQAMMTMIRCSTGEFWNGIMHDLTIDAPMCEANPQFSNTTCGFNTFDGCTPLTGCGAKVPAFMFFISFTVLVGMSLRILLQLCRQTPSQTPLACPLLSSASTQTRVPSFACLPHASFCIPEPVHLRHYRWLVGCPLHTTFLQYRISSL